MDADLEAVVALEWEMFQEVNAGGPRASCQDDRPTFEGMRRGQFSAWCPQALASYRRDLETAKAAGRNLVEEKYIRMMERTDPAQWDKLRDRLPQVTLRQSLLADAITETMVADTQALFAAYPLLTGRARPLRADGDTPWDTSVETYQRSELLTYSEDTLAILRDHLRALAQAGTSLARRTLENSVAYYGFSTLDEAEARLRAGREG